MLITYNNYLIEYKIVRKNIKNTYFRFKNNILVVSTNYFNSDESIKQLIIKHIDDIIKLKNKMSNNNSDPNFIYFKNIKYVKKIIISNENKIIIKDNIFYIYTKQDDINYINRIINLFFIENINQEVLKYKDKLDKLFNVNAKIIYKPLKSAYGKNYYLKSTIILNSFLAKFDFKYIKYILIHEYIHFKYQNHQKEFHDLFNKLMPENKILSKNLTLETKKIGLFF